MFEPLINVFSQVVNNFYKEGISVSLSEDPDTAYCVGNRIVLPTHLLEEFTQQKLPRFTVLYHELGHALYSENMTKLIEKWSNLPTSHNSFMYKEEYHNLVNWIEDLYIEEKLVKDYPYLTDIIGCLKRLTLPYDITEIDKAFNHYYVKGYTTPTLNPQDAYYFATTIKSLLTLRDSNNFGRGPISLLSNKSKESQYIKLLIEFYNWCVSKQIFDGSYVPPLQNPNMVNISSSQGTNTNSSNPSQGINQGTDQGTGQETDQDSSDSNDGGSYSDHSHMVGVQSVVPKFDPTEIELFSDKFVAEEKLIKEEINKQYRIEATQQSLDGLFNSLFKDSSIIQSKVIVPNFFNPNRLVDQVLFKTPEKSFNNVSIYRDISGSTHGPEFALINSICTFLNNKIPISYNFYLYASGNISILQTSFEDWVDHNEVPDVYANDPIFQQMHGGTNSSAIADVISEQLNDKWLNIIITDGDLCDLMRRDNINTLLENVFVISIGDIYGIENCPNHIIIRDESDINLIPSALLNMKGL